MLFQQGRVHERRILVKVWVSDPGVNDSPRDYDGLIDTGALSSGFSTEVVHDVGLYSSRPGKLYNVQGEVRDALFYRVNMYLRVYPNGDQRMPYELHGNEGLWAAETTHRRSKDLPFDVLIGMDLLSEFQLCVRRDSFRLAAMRR